MIDVSQKTGSITCKIRVVPRASRTEIAGEIDGAVKVRVASPPVEGAANAEVVKLFAKRLNVAKSSIEIVSGQSSKTKHIRIAGIMAEDLRNALNLSEPKSA